MIIPKDLEIIGIFFFKIKNFSQILTQKNLPAVGSEAAF